MANMLLLGISRTQKPAAKMYVEWPLARVTLKSWKHRPYIDRFTSNLALVFCSVHGHLLVHTFVRHHRVHSAFLDICKTSHKYYQRKFFKHKHIRPPSRALNPPQEFVKVTTSAGLDKDIEAAVGDFFTSASEGAAGNNVRR